MSASASGPEIPDDVEAAARAASDKLAHDITLVQVGDVLAITDWFVIASGNNRRQVRTISDEVSVKVKAVVGHPPHRVEGLDEATWVLIDFGDLVVHVFDPETRAYYDLERLWSDCPMVRWHDPDAPVASGQ